LITGANLSTINKSLAEKLGLKFLTSHLMLEAVLVYKQIGIRDLRIVLYIGDILVQNVVFLVVPDETDTFHDWLLLNGIIGYPVMEH